MKKVVLFTLSFIMLICCIVPLGAYATTDENRSAWVVEGLSYTTDTISYTKRKEVSKILVDDNTSFPAYYSDLSITNACGPKAGANLIGYYSSIYPQLISGFTAYATAKKAYNRNSNYTDPLTQTLYDSMKTNTKGAGTTDPNFKAAITDYAKSKGLKTSSESSNVLLNLIYSLDKTKTLLKQNKPVVIAGKNLYYIDSLSFVGATRGNTDTFSVAKVAPSHYMIAYGYVAYEYYNLNYVLEWDPVWYNPLRFTSVLREVNFRTDEYLMVSFGDGTLGYLNVGKSTITDGFTMHIYK